jgi:hypothetical protein
LFELEGVKAENKALMENMEILKETTEDAQMEAKDAQKRVELAESNMISR